MSRFTMGLALLAALLAWGPVAAPARAASLFAHAISDREFISVDKETAESTTVAPTSSIFRGLTYDLGSGTLFGLDLADEIFEIDPLTGSLDRIGSLSGGVNPVALAFNPADQKLYVADSNSLVLFDPEDGSTTAGPAISGGFTGIEGLSFDPSSGTLYGVAAGQSAVVTIDPVSGAATALPVTLPMANWRALAYDPATDALFLGISGSGGGSLWSVDLASNLLSEVGEFVNVQALTALPEPSTGFLLAGALGLAMARGDRRWS